MAFTQKDIRPALSQLVDGLCGEQRDPIELEMEFGKRAAWALEHAFDVLDDTEDDVDIVQRIQERIQELEQEIERYQQERSYAAISVNRIVIEELTNLLAVTGMLGFD